MVKSKSIRPVVDVVAGQQVADRAAHEVQAVAGRQRNRSVSGASSSRTGWKRAGITSSPSRTQNSRTVPDARTVSRTARRRGLDGVAGRRRPSRASTVADAVGQRVEVVAALQHHQPAARRHQRQHAAGERPVVAGRQAELGDRVVAVGVEARRTR